MVNRETTGDGGELVRFGALIEPAGLSHGTISVRSAVLPFFRSPAKPPVSCFSSKHPTRRSCFAVETD